METYNEEAGYIVNWISANYWASTYTNHALIPFYSCHIVPDSTNRPYNLRWPVSLLNYTSLGHGRKSEHLEETHRDTGRTCRICSVSTWDQTWTQTVEAVRQQQYWMSQWLPCGLDLLCIGQVDSVIRVTHLNIFLRLKNCLAGSSEQLWLEPPLEFNCLNEATQIFTLTWLTDPDNVLLSVCCATGSHV